MRWTCVRLGLPLVLLLVSCGAEDPVELTDAGVYLDAGPVDVGFPDSGDPSAALFAPDHLVEIAIEIQPQNWETLRHQARSIMDLIGASMCYDAPPTSPYTYFSSRVTIDGTSFDRVGVRKKGFFGSVNPIKPSLKLKLDEYVMGQEYLGLDRFTLNNGWQGNDRSAIHQCLGYEIFAQAGVPAPRCNYAHVTVNGRDMGIYINIEAMKKRFLARHFPNNDGHLYEGSVSDFRPVFIGTFEQKTDREIPSDHLDLEALADALTSPDQDLLDALDPLVDLESFRSFWTTEILIGHWDGYNGFNNNNFYIYNNPLDGRFVFMPWGIDSTFGFGSEDVVRPLYANGILSYRLYGLESERQRYVQRLRRLLDEIWSETTLLDEINRVETLIGPRILAEERQRFNASVDRLRTFVSNRKSQLESQLALGPPPWNVPLRDPVCIEQIGQVGGTFSTTWGTFPSANVFLDGQGTMSATVSEQLYLPRAVGSAAGVDERNSAIIQVVGMFEDNSLGAIIVYMPPFAVRPGTVDVELAGPIGALLFHVPQPGAQPEHVGRLGLGTITFTRAGTNPGDPVEGFLDLPLFDSP